MPIRYMTVRGAPGAACLLPAPMPTHRFPGTSDFDRRIQEAGLDNLVHSAAASSALAENYVGLPL